LPAVGIGFGQLGLPHILDQHAAALAAEAPQFIVAAAAAAQPQEAVCQETMLEEVVKLVLNEPG